MLLVDRVLDVVAGESLRAVKAVTAAEPCYAGLPDDADHGYPLVLMIESWCQAAALLACVGARPGGRDSPLTMLGGLTGVTVSGAAHPGDVLEHHVRLVRAARVERARGGPDHGRRSRRRPAAARHLRHHGAAPPQDLRHPQDLRNRKE
jgi:3-hydroxymyristoyl/3-hydroxydecanoyl-(acyl carrier protein) dehydratase